MSTPTVAALPVVSMPAIGTASTVGDFAVPRRRPVVFAGAPEVIVVPARPRVAVRVHRLARRAAGLPLPTPLVRYGLPAPVARR